MDKDNVRTLLLLYQQHPCLYVVKSVDYHNRIKREKALQTIYYQYTEITKESLTIEAAKKKLNNLRSQYLEHVNKIKHSKASGASTDEIYKPTWWLYEDMKFLDPYISQRKGESSISERFSKNQSDSLTSSIDSLIDQEDSEDIQFLDVYNVLKNEDCNKENIHQNIKSPSVSTSRSRSSTPTSKKRKCETSLETKNDFWTMASTAIESVSKKEETEDGLKHWILYLEAELRKIKNTKTIKDLKRKIIE